MKFELAGKWGRLIGFGAMVAAVLFVALNYQLYFDPELGLVHGTAIFVWTMIGAFGVAPLLIVKTSVDDKHKMLANVIMLFLMPVACLQMVECFNGIYIWVFPPKTWLANYLIYLVFFLFVYLLTGAIHWSILWITIMLYVFGMLNYFVELFRGTPFIPMDFATIRTGANVASGYNYSLSWQLISGTILLLLIYLLNRHTKSPRPEKTKNKILAKTLPAAFLAVMIVGFYCTPIVTDLGFKPDFWNQSRGYHKTGSFFNFCLNTKYLRVSKPTGYDVAGLEDSLNSFLEDHGVDPQGDTCTNLLTGENDYTATATEAPNIIYIMNESFADLQHVGDFETNQEVLPFINSLTENTIKGYVSIPVFGAGTSNSEFEALSGNTISFLPAGSNVFQLFIKGETPSIVSTLASQGYEGTAYHPYYGSGWNREFVYPALGFKDFISLEDFVDEDIIETYKQNNSTIEYQALLQERYPGKNMLLRRFIRDSYDYQMVEEMYEDYKAQNPDKPFFVFNVTMQNHGGYAVDYANFVTNIYPVNMSDNYPKAKRYVSLAHQSDAAFSQIVDYYSKVDEPTIICMFGDHFPTIEDEFYEEIMGCTLDEAPLELEQKRYETPFIIWANYDIPEAEIEHISANYLSTLLLQTAGLEMPAYNKYLASLYQELPIIDTVAYMGKDGTLYPSGSESEYTPLLQQYNCLEYNAMFGKADRQDQLFYIDR